MRLRRSVIGALNMLGIGRHQLTEQDMKAAQALTDAATVGLLQYRAVEEARQLSRQLQIALDSRVAIEQAKGVISHQLDLDMAAAFNVLRTYSRKHRRRVLDVAEDVVLQMLTADELFA